MASVTRASRITAAVVSASVLSLGTTVPAVGTGSTGDIANPWLETRFLNIAHAGGEREAPYNTMYAFERAADLGADALELDIHATKDDQLVVIHDATVDATTNGSGRVRDLTYDQVHALDAAYNFVPGQSAVPGLPPESYPLRGVRTHDKKPPAGFKAKDFAIPRLKDVLKEFPDVPINIEIKGTSDTDTESFLHNARLLAKQLNRTDRTDIIVTSFNDAAIATFHELAPHVPLAPGLNGLTQYFLSGVRPIDGTVALQIPVQFSGIPLATPEFIARAHADGYAVHVWFSGSAPEDEATYNGLIDACADGLMVALPTLLEEILDQRGIARPGTPGIDPCKPPIVVTTDNETPVLYDDDEGGNASGDDPAIWVHPKNSARSMVIVTAKEGGLRVYDLDSTELQSLAAVPAPRADGVDGRYNNVDIAYGMRLDRQVLDVAVVSDRYNDQLRFFVIDPAGADAATPLVEVTAPEQPFLFNPDRATVDEQHTAYGVAVWQPRNGSTYAVITQEGATTIATARIVEQGGAFGYTDVEHLEMPGRFPLPDGTTWVPCEEPGVLPQLEGVAVDQRSGVLYATQEDVGLWRIQLPLGSGEPVLLDRVADFGIHDSWNPETEECEPIDPAAKGFGGPNLVADAEGVDIYYGRGKTGYVVVSSQGDDRFAVYDTTGKNRSLGTFRVAGAGVDDVNGSDGLAVTNRVVGDYREGLLVTHDEPESGPDVDPDRDPTNFSYVHWGEVADALGLQVSTRAGNDPRLG